MFLTPNIDCKSHDPLSTSELATPKIFQGLLSREGHFPKTAGALMPGLRVSNTVRFWRLRIIDYF